MEGDQDKEPGSESSLLNILSLAVAPDLTIIGILVLFAVLLSPFVLIFYFVLK